MKAVYLTLAVGALALAGCDAANKAETSAANNATPVDAAAVEQELRSIEAAWEKDYQAHDADKAASHYADDAALANPGMALASDAAARKTVVAQFASDPNMKLSFASDRVGVAQSGELAYTRGHYTIETTDPASKQNKSETGSYLTVWKKQADGSWKAIEDFVVPGAPAAE